MDSALARGQINTGMIPLHAAAKYTFDLTISRFSLIRKVLIARDRLLDVRLTNRFNRSPISLLSRKSILHVHRYIYIRWQSAKPSRVTARETSSNCASEIAAGWRIAPFSSSYVESTRWKSATRVMRQARKISSRGEEPRYWMRSDIQGVSQIALFPLHAHAKKISLRRRNNVESTFFHDKGSTWHFAIFVLKRD